MVQNGQRGFKIRGYSHARQIVDKFNSCNEAYMRSLVNDVFGDGEYAERLRYHTLRQQAFRIHGAAQRMLEQQTRRQTLQTVAVIAPSETEVASSEERSYIGEQLQFAFTPDVHEVSLIHCGFERRTPAERLSYFLQHH